MKIRTSLIIEESLLKKLKKEAIDKNKKYSELLNEILENYFKIDTTNSTELKDMF